MHLKLIQHKCGVYILVRVNFNGAEFMYQAFTVDFNNHLWAQPISESCVKVKFTDGQIHFIQEDPVSVLLFNPLET